MFVKLRDVHTVVLRSGFFSSGLSVQVRVTSVSLAIRLN